MNYRYYAAYKPFGMLTQFSGEGETLGALGDFPPDVYPVGRLDKDSEGLLLLTNDPRLNGLLLDPVHAHARTYWVQVEGDMSPQALEKLGQGLPIRIKGKQVLTAKASARLQPEAEALLPERIPPIRYRKHVPDTWIALTLREGKNRQVRRMTAAVGFPTLRLVRWAIEGLTVAGFRSGEVRTLEPDELETLLGISLLQSGSLPKKR
ncbi:pseudouridine synthase [Cyclobacterium xiamenense]|uniref:pseudouridine synthase n=1 Tax=Cyclobacterium xiamenense TaxID=1297121 RepID=UPI0035CF2FC8